MNKNFECDPMIRRFTRLLLLTSTAVGTERSEQTIAQQAAQLPTGPTDDGLLHNLLHKQMIEFETAKMKCKTLWCMTDFIDSETTHNESVITVVNACPHEKSKIIENPMRNTVKVLCGQCSFTFYPGQTGYPKRLRKSTVAATLSRRRHDCNTGHPPSRNPKLI